MGAAASKPIALAFDVREGAMRLNRLTPAERDFYRWILREFAQHGRPTRGRLVEVAFSVGIDAEPVLARLAEEDLLHLDPRDGEIVVAYPFSGVSTAHRVRFDSGAGVFAMCAVDALGIPFMLGEPAEIVSLDPITGAEITLRVRPGATLDWRPEEAVVLWAGTRCDGPSAATCCQFVHFFSSRESASAYLFERASMSGEILDLPVAAELGRTIFGEVLRSGER